MAGLYQDIFSQDEIRQKAQAEQTSPQLGAL